MENRIITLKDITPAFGMADYVGYVLKEEFDKKMRNARQEIALLEAKIRIIDEENKPSDNKANEENDSDKNKQENEDCIGSLRPFELTYLFFERRAFPLLGTPLIIFIYEP